MMDEYNKNVWEMDVLYCFIIITTIIIISVIMSQSVKVCVMYRILKQKH